MISVEDQLKQLALNNNQSAEVLRLAQLELQVLDPLRDQSDSPPGASSCVVCEERPWLETIGFESPNFEGLHPLLGSFRCRFGLFSGLTSQKGIEAPTQSFTLATHVFPFFNPDANGSGIPEPGRGRQSLPGS